jgi:tetratricopeptide (TPR) repeat protein
MFFGNYMDGLNIKDALKLAVEKHNQVDLREAETLYKKILEKEVENPDALNLLGAIDYQNRKYPEAIEKISRAIQINPENAIYYYNLAMSYDALGEIEKSAENFEKVIGINPDYNKVHIAHYNLGIYFRDKGEFEKAIGHYDRAIEFGKKNTGKEFFDALWNKGLVLLLLGKFEGWKYYEARFKKESPTDKRIFDKPKWDGSFLDGKKILVASEQGFGDNIQFARYLSLVKERRGYVIFECRKELMKLFENSGLGVDEFVEKGKSFPDYDFYIHLMSLPGIFKTDLQSISNKIPYLKSGIKKKFDNKFKIGIVWSGNPDFPGSKEKSVNPEYFKFLAEIPEVKLYSLQKGKFSGGNFEITDLSGEMDDFFDTAGIIENLDLVISVDTAVAHLAGALGKKIWVLLPFIPDWRWLLDRKDSPWYPEMKLFRQKKSGDWNSVFEEVKNEIENFIEIFK